LKLSASAYQHPSGAIDITMLLHRQLDEAKIDSAVV